MLREGRALEARLSTVIESSMKVIFRPVRPCILKPTILHYSSFDHCSCKANNSLECQAPKKRKRFLVHSIGMGMPRSGSPSPTSRLGRRWMEYHGANNWDGLLDPLDDNLRFEIIRYGNFVEAAYASFDFNPSSPSYATCRYPKSSLLERSGFRDSGYRLTKNLRVTSSIQLPRWMEMAPAWMVTQTSWIGYVAVCSDKREVSRLGRRDVVIVYRGTATCLEWLENLRATLCLYPHNGSQIGVTTGGSSPMVESGFLGLYSSGTPTCPSLQQLVKEEISKILRTFGDEPLSITITGHSLGAALAVLTAYDIKMNFKHANHVTVISFGGPRLGNRSFRSQLEKQGIKILRIVNSDDVVTKVPGFVMQDKINDHVVDNTRYWMTKIQKRIMEDSRLVYADVGEELRLSSRNSPFLDRFNVVACHDMKTYLHLVNGSVSSSSPFTSKYSSQLNV